MEQKNRHLIWIFLTILIMNFIAGFFERELAFDWFFMSLAISSIFSLIIISPIVFTIFYLIGKKFYLKSNLKWTIISLFLGAILGYLLSSGYWFIRTEAFRSFMLLFGFYFPITIFLTFFVAFSALAIAYLRNNNFTNEEKTRMSENSYLSKYLKKSIQEMKY